MRAMAALLLLLGMAVGGAVFGSLGLAHGFYWLVDFYPERTSHWGGRLQWIAKYWGWRLDYAVAGLLGLAAIGLGPLLRLSHLAQHACQTRR